MGLPPQRRWHPCVRQIGGWKASAALGDYVSQFLGMDEPRRRLAAEMSGLGIHYELGEGRPLLGRRTPDLDLTRSPLGSERLPRRSAPASRCVRAPNASPEPHLQVRRLERPLSHQA